MASLSAAKKRASRPKRRGKVQFLSESATSFGTAVERMLMSKSAPIDLKEVAIEFMQKVGGPQGFVKLILDDYQASEAGTPERARLWELAVRLFTKAQEDEATVDHDMTTDDDLQAEAAYLMARMGVGAVVWVDHVCI